MLPRDNFKIICAKTRRGFVQNTDDNRPFGAEVFKQTRNKVLAQIRKKLCKMDV